MNLFETFASLLAPHTCLKCGLEGSPLCKDCAEYCLNEPPATCYKCQKPGLNPCKSCKSPLNRVFVAVDYQNEAKSLVKCLKFERVKAASEVIAEQMHYSLPKIPSNTVVVPIPTVNKRIRNRGYDQACLIAKKLAKKRKLKYRELLRRRGSTRQVGANRNQRTKQLKNAYMAKKSLKNINILLVDDVLTTGSTIEAAANALKTTGNPRISAALFAYAAPKLANSSNTRSDLVSVQ